MKHEHYKIMNVQPSRGEPMYLFMNHEQRKLVNTKAKLLLLHQGE
jgi:hypothetical protein